jgi:predicted Zn-dependent protease with MMP-like domain
VHLSRQEFESIITEAIEGLPEEFAEKLENVEFVIEDYPGRKDYEDSRIDPGIFFLGLYRGVPLVRRSPFDLHIWPDQIIIYQRSIERICRTREEIIDEVRRTVLHEIGHHFGISDQRLEELGC